MRKIITTTFVTLDGVMQAPGGPGEDTSDNFKYGGWQFGWDEVADKIMMEGFMTIPFDLLLGRRTYDIFAPYWSTAKTEPRVSEPFNKAKKYVVSHAPVALSWNNSELITGDVVTAIKKLKDTQGPDLWVHGSGNLIQTLLKHNLIDRMHIWIYPITVGVGKKLFADGTLPQRFKLLESKTSTTGVIIATYEPSEQLTLPLRGMHD